MRCLQLLDEVLIFIVVETYDITLLAGSPSASRTVQVVGGAFREIKVDHVGQVREIQPARSQVRAE